MQSGDPEEKEESRTLEQQKCVVCLVCLQPYRICMDDTGTWHVFQSQSYLLAILSCLRKWQQLHSQR